MDRIIIDQIPFHVEERTFMDHLRIRSGSRNASRLSTLLSEALGIASPKAAFAVAEAHPLSGDIVEIGGVHLQGRLLCDNLEKAGNVFPFVATCGVELEAWSKQRRSVIHAFWADAIMYRALGCAVSHLEAGLRAKTGSGELSCMNPGSLPKWPLSEQAHIFALLGESAATVGVRLMENMSMRPLKSISGIYFMSEKGFCNCELCSRECCITRRASYNAGQKNVAQ